MDRQLYMQIFFIADVWYQLAQGVCCCCYIIGLDQGHMRRPRWNLCSGIYSGSWQPQLQIPWYWVQFVNFYGAVVFVSLQIICKVQDCKRITAMKVNPTDHNRTYFQEMYNDLLVPVVHLSFYLEPYCYVQQGFLDHFPLYCIHHLLCTFNQSSDVLGYWQFLFNRTAGLKSLETFVLGYFFPVGSFPLAL